MSAKRKIEIFSAGCPLCEEAVSQVKTLACPGCEITVLEMNKKDFAYFRGSRHVISHEVDTLPERSNESTLVF